MKKIQKSESTTVQKTPSEDGIWAKAFSIGLVIAANSI